MLLLAIGSVLTILLFGLNQTTESLVLHTAVPTLPQNKLLSIVVDVSTKLYKHLVTEGRRILGVFVL